MSCSNCFNGCAEIVSDQCVRYTGIDVPILGIKNGDSLSYVEQALIEFLTSTLNGTGIILEINPAIICNIVSKNLVTCENLSLPNVISAIIKAVCEIDARLVVVENKFVALEGPYTIGCLTGVTSTSGTHAILQAVITKLCAHIVDFNAFVLDVETNYVKKSELCALVAACTPPAPPTSYKDRMVPFTVVEYYGTITGNFDGTGKGLGAWDKIYLCNGSNGTPDKRGRVGVGATTGMAGGPLNPAVDPAVAGNPTYTLLGTAGANSITLTTPQIPAHTHTTDPKISDPGHTHFTTLAGSQVAITTTTPLAQTATYGGNTSYSLAGAVGTPDIGITNSKTTGITIIDKAISSTGGGLAHSNFQPGLGCYYIMYIP
jgi:microcystin-dependent protein